MTPSSWFDSKVTVSDRTGSRAFLGEMVKVVEAPPPAGTGLHVEGRGRGSAWAAISIEEGQGRGCYEEEVSDNEWEGQRDVCVELQ